MALAHYILLAISLGFVAARATDYSKVDPRRIFGRNDLAIFNGQVTDDNLPWDSYMANPGDEGNEYMRKSYVYWISEALKAKNSTAYGSVQIYTSQFSGTYINKNLTATIIYFVIGLPPNGQSASDIDADLEKGAQMLNYIWRNVDIRDAVLPPLPEACQTAGCQEAAQMFLSSINFTVDPCQNFYSYSCDNYIAKHPIGDAPTQSTFDVLQTQAFANLSKAFESLQAIAEKSQTMDTSSRVYQACKAVTNESYMGPKILYDIANVYGGWPLLDSTWDISKVPENIYYAMGDMFSQYGVATLLVPAVEIDARNIKKHTLYLDQASLAIPADYYRNPNLTEQYKTVLKNTIIATAFTMNTSIDILSLEPEIDEMVEIEYHLAMISVNGSDQRNMSLGYNSFTSSNAEAEFPAFNWTGFFHGLLHNIYPGEDPITLLDPFIIAEPHRYGRDLETFLDAANKDATKMKNLINYLIFRLIAPYSQFATPELSKVFKDLKRNTRINGGGFGEKTEMSEQEEECVGYLAQSLPYAAGRLYIDSSFPPIYRDDVSVMINNVLSAFSSSLSGLRWMDNESALKAFQKVAGLVRNVAYADWQMDDQKLDAYHQGLIDATKSIDVKDPQAFYKFNTEVVKFSQMVLFHKLKQEGDRTEFGMSSAIVNAWYQPIRNSITFPAAILNQPFYRYDFPFAVNYGGLGVVMGHELSHGFDDQGVQFDWDGTMRTWMTPHAEGGFTKMAQCVVDEYSRFCYPQVSACINGITTQGENIGDNGGIKAAYRAYKAYEGSHGVEAPLPGMETFTMDQIFFLSFGQVWCGSYSESALLRQLLTNPHSPGKDRVIGAVQNFPKFAEAFNCKRGDPMYPANACDVW